MKKYHSLLKKRNVIGYGLGKKVIKGKNRKENCITVLVEKKKPLSELSAQDLVPKKLDNTKTDVIEIGRIRAQVNPPETHKLRFRPALAGISIGHEEVTAGTFGVVVYDAATDQPLILSNNHVLANSNDARVGDPIWQPARFDGGSSKDKIGTLHKFIPIQMNREDSNPDNPPSCSFANFALNFANNATKLVKPHYTWQLSRQEVKSNLVDAALAKPTTNNLIKNDIMDIGKVEGTRNATVGLKVQKSGRTTGYTTGTIQVTDATVTVNFGNNAALFEGQIVATNMSQGGDSGSLVLDMKNKAVGLLFAGSDQATILNPIGLVLQQLNVYFK